jgi:hypothetical protein
LPGLCFYAYLRRREKEVAQIWLYAWGFVHEKTFYLDRAAEARTELPVNPMSLELHPMPNLDEFFASYTDSRRLFDALHAAVTAIGPSEMRVTKSQVAFRRGKAFAWAWIPGQYLRWRIAPLVLTLALRRRDPSPRWKKVVEPYPGRFTHHLEIWVEEEIDNQVRQWLREAWEAADIK